MEELKDFIGEYYFEEIGNEKFSTEYILKITEGDIKICFSLEMIINAVFGKNGRIWTGVCVERDTFISLIADEETEWAITKYDTERTENSKTMFEILPIELYKEQDFVILNFTLNNKKIKLERR